MFPFDPATYRDNAEAHARWCGTHSQEAELQFRRRFELDPEAAVLELSTRQLLVEDGVDVHLGDLPGEGGIDFNCQTKGVEFQVEAMAWRVETVEERVSIPQVPSGGFTYKSFTAEIVRVLTNPRKQRQFGRAKQPLLVVLGTPHFTASSILTDSLLLEWMYCEAPHPCALFTRDDPETGHPVVHPNISALLFFGPAGRVSSRRTGSRLISAGAMNPDANRQFDPSLLPHRVFCHHEGYDLDGNPSCRWTRGRHAIRRP